MKSIYVRTKLDYDGSQLRSLYGYLEHGLMGDSIVSFQGACDVSFDHMIDGEDIASQSKIAGAAMLHFIVEKFHASLLAGVALQRLLASLCLDLIRERAGPRIDRASLRRDGDDIFFDDDRKLSISVATSTPVSVLIHFAVNVTNEGVPVRTCSLGDLGLEPEAFARELMTRFTREMETIEEATVKVRWAK